MTIPQYVALIVSGAAYWVALAHWVVFGIGTVLGWVL